MLVLSRKENETIIVGEGDSAAACKACGHANQGLAVVLTVLAIHGNRVSIGIEAPKEVKILRGELEVANG